MFSNATSFDQDLSNWNTQNVKFIKCIFINIPTIHMFLRSLRSLVRKRKRFSKWFKAEKINDLELIKQYYGYNNQRAREALSLLPKEHLDYIRFKMHKGGKTQNI